MKLDGTNVRDAVRSCVLKINKADANSGQGNPATCAAAKAACRVAHVVEARIYRTRSYLLVENTSGGRCWVRYGTPGALRIELIAFDRGGTFDPGEYVLETLPDNKHIGQERHSKPAGPKRKKRAAPHVIRGIRPRAPINAKA
jgi:hypothetical protein